jgi:hypothetical protein
MPRILLLAIAVVLTACTQTTPPPQATLPPQSQSHQNAEAITPYSNVLTYDANFPTVSRCRLSN